MGHRIMIIWADDHSPNLGVRALAEGARELALRVYGSESVILLQDFGGRNSGVAFGPKSIVRDFFSINGRIKTLIREYDVILDTGAGDSFSDIYGLKRFLTMAYIQWLALSLGKSVILTPQTIGPFKSWIGKSIARFMLPKFTQVIARDRRSADVAVKFGRVDVVAASDLVFMLPRLAGEGPQHDILLNVSGLLWASNPHLDSKFYRVIVKDLIEQLSQAGRRVTLLAHVVGNASTDDDAGAIEELLSAVGEPCETLIPKDLNEVRSALSNANLVIGARMHACLNALSVGTPAIPWAYSRKFEPLLREIGWNEIVDLRTSADPVSETLALMKTLEGERGFSLANASAEQGQDASQRAVHAISALESTLES